MSNAISHLSDKISSPPLYQRLLGLDWQLLKPAVRRAHRGKDGGQWRGRLRVKPGRSLAARIARILLRLPAAGQSVPTRLTIESNGKTERWKRYFGATCLLTTQTSDSAGNLVERVKCAELRFRLSVVDGNMLYSQVGAALCIGPLRLSLPRVLWPRVTAHEQAAGTNRTKVCITVSLPMIGLLTSYKGEMKEVTP